MTVPPVDEYSLEVTDYTKGITFKTRTAEQTKDYADASREVGNELGVAILDLWSIFMQRAGWKEGQPLPGSKKAVKNDCLGTLLRDGM